MLEDRSAALGGNTLIFTYALGNGADPQYTTEIARRNGGLSQVWARDCAMRL